RWRQFPQGPAALLKLADQQSHGALVLGEWRPFAARDWSQQPCIVQIGTGAAQSFRGSLSLVDPTWLLPIWLQHVTRQGATVPRGTIVTTGTWCGMLKAERGDKVKVVFEGIGEAEVQL
ncbi:MAG: 2-keto-4-pentenoate hydratase-like protein, partial [Ramlibacter sp.]|nr:2-keto-4-pentenoate hydratase-like protein [Ramlibacter sp.]